MKWLDSVALLLSFALLASEASAADWSIDLTPRVTRCFDSSDVQATCEAPLGLEQNGWQFSITAAANPENSYHYKLGQLSRQQCEKHLHENRNHLGSGNQICLLGAKLVPSSEQLWIKSNVPKKGESAQGYVTRCFKMSRIKVECESFGAALQEMVISAQSDKKKYAYIYGKALPQALCQEHFARIREVFFKADQACLTGAGELASEDGEIISRWMRLQTKRGSVPR